jgi:hypothetical protein
MEPQLFSHKTERWSKWFVISAGIILLLTGLAKLISSFGNARILGLSDPVLNVSFRSEMLIVGIVELVVASVCVFTKLRKISVFLIAWLSTGFLLYRLGLWLIGWNQPCPCMGNLTDILRITPQIADLIMKSILVYLLAGSYLVLSWQFVNSLNSRKLSN